uniref:DUF2922 domain-containing protein n=1 Tax=Strongyloides papillosus TaxID=174720 RepID=A0A0N5BE35_STREA
MTRIRIMLMTKFSYTVEPEYHHIEAYFLTDESIRVDMNENQIEVVSAVIRALYDSSTLAKANGVLTTAEVSGNLLCIALTALKWGIAEKPYH